MWLPGIAGASEAADVSPAAPPAWSSVVIGLGLDERPRPVAQHIRVWVCAPDTCQGGWTLPQRSPSHISEANLEVAWQVKILEKSGVKEAGIFLLQQKGSEQEL